MPKNTKVLKKEFENDAYVGLLKDIYIDEKTLLYNKKRYIKAIDEFEKLYGEQDVEIYSAPGRSEIGGNHTDHQYGRVLAASINLDAIAIVAKTNDGIITIKSEGYPMIKVHLDMFEPMQGEFGTSSGLIRGVTAKIKEDGYQVGGFNAYVTSDVINGAGMSSSAAFEVLIGTILSGLYNEMKISPILIAQAGQYAENVFFGKPCGLMDQMASAVGNLIYINFADVKNPQVRKVNVDFEDFKHSLCIVDTKGSHENLTDEYAAIPKEMKKVANYFGKEVLNEVIRSDFYKNLPKIRKQVGDRATLRALHWFEETNRVITEVEALEVCNFDVFLKLVNESGNSSFEFLQNVYSTKNLNDQAVSIALAISKVVLQTDGACRVHGGGFAGTIQAFVPNDMVNTYKSKIEKVFGKGACHILKIRRYGGIKVL